MSLNPSGEVPVLVTDDMTLFDSQAILGWLARRHAPERLPLEADAFAKILAWLSVAGTDMTAGDRAMRAVPNFGPPGDLVSGTGAHLASVTHPGDDAGRLSGRRRATA